MRNKVTVSQAAHDRRADTLSLLFAHLPDHERDEQVREFVSAEDRQELPLNGLLSAEVEGSVVGAILYLMQTDQCAYFWPPAVTADFGDRAAMADVLLAELKRCVKAEHAWIAQCLVEPQASDAREALTRNGFFHLADLDYLSRALDDPLPAPAEKPLQTVALQPDENLERFGDLIDRTYVDSLDCPGLAGIRSGVDAVASHSATGVFMPEQWTIVRDDDRDVGVLIFADHPDQDAWEVVYMGILPEARGRGYGKAMLLHGLHQARRGGRGSVLLAVDSCNRYARRVYDELGFRLLETRSVHVMFPMAKNENPQVVHSQENGS